MNMTNRQIAELSPPAQSVRSAMRSLGYDLPEENFLHSVDERSFFFLAVFIAGASQSSILVFSFDRRGYESYRNVQGIDSDWLNHCYVRVEDKSEFGRAMEDRARGQHSRAQ
jgi:hypothetical protein